MEKEHKSALRQSRVALVRDLQTENLFDHLEAKGVFTSLMLEYIKAEPARPDKVRHLLDDLCRRGPNAYRLFLECLRESNQEFLADKILEQENKIRSGGNPRPSVSPVGSEPALHHPTSEPEAPYQYSGISMNQTARNNLSQNAGSEDSIDAQSFDIGSRATGNSEPVQATQDMDLDELDLSYSNENVSLDLYSNTRSNIGDQSTPYQSLRSQDRCYKMDSSPRGKAIIINNKDFSDGSVREGTDADKERLLQLFQNVLNLDVKIKNNLTAESIREELQIFATDQDLNQVDCLVVSILSHGSNDKVYGTDYQMVNVNDIFDIFGASNCRAMIGKPKLFLINACRGDSDGQYVMSGANTHHDAVERDIRPIAPRPNAIPVQSDIIAAFSTFPGFVSLRDRDDGSWFVQSFVDVFTEMAQSEHVLDMLIEVNRIVGSRYDGNVGMQMPFPSYSITKKWYLNPVS